MVTMSHGEAMDAMERLKAPIAIPMHFISTGAVQNFVARAEEAGYAVRRHGGSELLVSLQDLPSRPEVVFLEGW